jgi:hypothetical protein
MIFYYFQYKVIKFFLLLSITMSVGGEGIGYAQFKPNIITPSDIDPVSNCVGSSSYFNPDGLTSQNLGIDLCDKFMGKRCSNNWDPYCYAYLSKGHTDMGGFSMLNRKFLEAAAKAKYCRAAVNAPGSQCTLRCEPFNPQAASSASVCDWVGTQNWLDTKDEADLAGNFPQGAMLNPLSPVFMDRCPYVCDAKGLSEIVADDTVMNMCIDTGSCSDTLMELAYYVKKNGIPVKNPKFSKYLEFASIDKPFNPNIVARIAKNFSLPINQALELLDQPPTGGPQDLYLTAPKNLKPDQNQIHNPKMKEVLKEHYPSVNKHVIKQNCNLLLGVGVVIIIAIILYFILKKKV